MLIKIN